MGGGEVRLVELAKRFEDVTAVDGIDLHVPGGELFSLLGPSGCGKTTTLRLVAGFEQKALQEAVGITFLYVTHDQEEALTLSDRLAVMSGGRIEQVGTPAEVYEEPASTYVAGFLGVANLMTATASGSGADGRCRLRLGEFDLRAAAGDTAASGEVRVVIRPERVRLEPYGSTGENRLPGMVERLVYQGSSTQFVVRLAHGEAVSALVKNQGAPLPWQQDTAVAAHLPADALRVLPEAAVRSAGAGA
jgi:spermidine/putrescine transport system ATP-binding protein